ncbi:hypothetical protein TREES_T100014097 [Tupaia chinensis]|uniref:Uncharacterized protein n=1 Tax=Tupaia chinensis TaxID=246437 RepID=L9KJZ3_TUPCH|nr:hypothetical protein TREES_T100014097 [Tupaia chinensis]
MKGAHTPRGWEVSKGLCGREINAIPPASIRRFRRASVSQIFAKVPGNSVPGKFQDAIVGIFANERKDRGRSGTGAQIFFNLVDTITGALCHIDKREQQEK